MNSENPTSRPQADAHDLASRAPGSRARLVRWLAAPIFAAAVVGAYWPSFRAEFEFDDSLHIVNNPAIKDLARLVDTLLAPGFFARRPLAALTFAIDYRIGRLDVTTFHVSSLLWHLATGGLVYLLTRLVLERAGWSGPRWLLSLLATAAFLLHPLQTEAVTYVVQRSEVLAAFFTVATLLLLDQAQRRLPRTAGWGCYLAALLVFGAGLASKQTAVVAPVLYLALSSWFPIGPAGRWRRVAFHTPLLALAAWYAIGQLEATRGRADVGLGVAGLDPLRYLQTQARVILTYLRLLVWPSGQNLDWDYHLSDGWGDPSTLAGLAGMGATLGACALALWWSLRSTGNVRALLRLGSFGLVWFLIALAPTSSVIPIVDILVEHRLYLASWGVALAVVAAFTGLWAHFAADRPATRARTAAAAVTVVAALLALGAATFARNLTWESRVTLWRDVVAKSPGKARGHANLGVALAMRRRNAEAVESYRKALALLPRGGTEWVTVARNLGYSLTDLGRHDESAAVLDDAVRLAPWSSELRETLAINLLARGEAPAAEAMARETLALDPRSGEAHDVLGEALVRRGALREALTEFEAAVSLNPDRAGRLANLARTQEALGMRVQACDSWAQVLRVDRIPPRLAEARSRLSSLGCGVR